MRITQISMVSIQFFYAIILQAEGFHYSSILIIMKINDLIAILMH